MTTENPDLQSGMDDGGRSHFAVEVDDLAHRISTLRDTITTLHQTFTSRHSDLQQSNLAVGNCVSVMTEVETALVSRSDSEEMTLSPELCVDEITLLRSQLLKLSRAESQLTETGPERLSSSTALVAVREKDNMVSTLQVWQRVFQETLAKYNRLSSLLASQQAQDLALRLWENHLDQVTEGLAAPTSQSYTTIAEQMRVISMQRSLLLQSQQQLMLRQPSQRTELVKGLSRRSHEVLDQIDERNSLLRSRQAMWDNFSLDQDKLHSWLREMEREKQLLNLKHVALVRVPVVLTKIKQLLERIPAGERLLAQLSAQQKDLRSNFDSSSLASVRQSLHSFQERLSSVRAGLLTWSDHLNRLDLLKAEEQRLSAQISQQMESPARLVETDLPTDRDGDHHTVRGK